MEEMPKPDVVVGNLAPIPDCAIRSIMGYKTGIVESRWIPDAYKPCDGHPLPKQREFLLSPAREVFLGGDPGAGKTMALLMAAAQYVDVPGYRALILCETFRHLRMPGGIFSVSQEWWEDKGPTWDKFRLRWHFPSGATMTFHCFGGRDEDGMGPASCLRQNFIGIDEAAHLSEENYLRLLVCLRRENGSDVPLRMRLTGTRQGPGVEWIERRFLKEKHPDRVFIHSRMEDNPHIDQAAFQSALEALDPVTRDGLRGWGTNNESQ